MALTGGKHGLIEISHVVSYENFGLCLVWIDDTTENQFEKECNQTYDGGFVGFGNFEKIMGYWEEKASVPQVRVMSNRLYEGENRILHICLTPPNRKFVKGTSNKFKLLGVRVY